MPHARGPERKIIDNLGDEQFKGMEKWEYKVKSADGLDSVVHYVRDPKTGELMDFKFKKHRPDMPGGRGTDSLRQRWLKHALSVSKINFPCSNDGEGDEGGVRTVSVA